MNNNSSFDDALIRMINSNRKAQREEQLEIARIKSVGKEKKVKYETRKKAVAVSLSLCIMLIIGTISFGIGKSLANVSSNASYTLEMDEVKEAEIIRIKDLLEKNGIKTEPVSKGTLTKAATYENNYDGLKDQISDDDAYAFYEFFRKEGLITAEREMEKIIKVLGYPDWKRFLANVNVLGEYGFYEYKYDSNGNYSGRYPSIYVWQKHAKRAAILRYENPQDEISDLLSGGPGL